MAKVTLPKEWLARFSYRVATRRNPLRLLRRRSMMFRR